MASSLIQQLQDFDSILKKDYYNLIKQYDDVNALCDDLKISIDQCKPNLEAATMLGVISSKFEEIQSKAKQYRRLQSSLYTINIIGQQDEFRQKILDFIELSKSKYCDDRTHCQEMTKLKEEIDSIFSQFLPEDRPLFDFATQKQRHKAMELYYALFQKVLEKDLEDKYLLREDRRRREL